MKNIRSEKTALLAILVLTSFTTSAISFADGDEAKKQGQEQAKKKKPTKKEQELQTKLEELQAQFDQQSKALLPNPGQFASGQVQGQVDADFSQIPYRQLPRLPQAEQFAAGRVQGMSVKGGTSNTGSNSSKNVNGLSINGNNNQIIFQGGQAFPVDADLYVSSYEDGIYDDLLNASLRVSYYLKVARSRASRLAIRDLSGAAIFLKKELEMLLGNTGGDCISSILHNPNWLTLSPVPFGFQSIYYGNFIADTMFASVAENLSRNAAAADAVKYLVMDKIVESIIQASDDLDKKYYLQTVQSCKGYGPHTHGAQCFRRVNTVNYFETAKKLAANIMSLAAGNGDTSIRSSSANDRVELAITKAVAYSVASILNQSAYRRTFKYQILSLISLQEEIDLVLNSGVIYYDDLEYVHMMTDHIYTGMNQLVSAPVVVRPIPVPQYQSQGKHQHQDDNQYYDDEYKP